MAIGKILVWGVVATVAGGVAVAAVSASTGRMPGLAAPDTAAADMQAKYQKLAGELGAAKGDIRSDIPGWEGKYREYAKGTIYWTKSSGARAVFGKFYAEYARRGGPAGPLGAPTTDQLWMYDGVGVVQKFRKGELILRDPKGNFFTALMAEETLVDLPVPAGEVWRVVQANGITEDDSHGDGWAYCYDLVRADKKHANTGIPAAATARIAWTQENLPSGETYQGAKNPGNVVVQALGRGRYASYLHIAPGSYTQRFAKGKVSIPNGPWSTKLVAPAGTILANVGDTGTDNYHLHFCVTTAPDRPGFAPFESVPVAFRNIEVSGDGVLWSPVAASTPVAGIYVRHAGFGGAAKIGSNNPLGAGKVSGVVNLAPGVVLPAGGKLVIDVMSPWGEPVATLNRPIPADNLKGPWPYLMMGVPSGPNLVVQARYEGPPIAGADGLTGKSTAGTVPSNGAKENWNMTVRPLKQVEIH